VRGAIVSMQHNKAGFTSNNKAVLLYCVSIIIIIIVFPKKVNNQKIRNVGTIVGSVAS